MTDALWTLNELMQVLPFAVADGTPSRSITGFSIDTRSLQPGDVFVALKDQRDGHEFVASAFKAGAAAAIVGDHYPRQPGDGALIKCQRNWYTQKDPDILRTLPPTDPLLALMSIGRNSRLRLDRSARVIAVTGSAGKTGTKEMLRACLLKVAPGEVHASEKSYNNHWGVPLTLANMPRHVQYGVFEIGMNHSGEIKPLSEMVRPHATIITTVEAVHLEHFGSVEDIADAKSEIFEGLKEGGTAIIKRDNPHFERLRTRAIVHGARVVTFGLGPNADVYAENFEPHEDGSEITARVGGKKVNYRLAMPGRHIAENSLAVVAALEAVGADVEKGIEALAELAPPSGRGLRARLLVSGGEVLLIDESYNANPASMRAALATLATIPRGRFQRRIVVLGDMLELGLQAGELHRGLQPAIDAAGADLVFACGPNMKGLYDSLRPAIKGSYFETAAALEPALVAEIRSGDVVMVKGSNGLKLGALVGALRRRYGEVSSPVFSSPDSRA